jgi:hypothetical protein
MQRSNSRRFTLKALTAAVALTTLSAVPAFAADTIKVGILHSLSGTMAISETVLKDTVLMAIDEINAKGGVLGKKLEPVVVDPASNWPLFAENRKKSKRKTTEPLCYPFIRLPYKVVCLLSGSTAPGQGVCAPSRRRPFAVVLSSCL